MRYTRRHQCLFLAPCLLIFLFASCQTKTVTSQYVRIPDDIWKQENKIRFEVVIDDTLSKYQFYLMVRNTTDYSFSNLYLFLETKFPDGRSGRDTLECFLADPSGKWTGNGLGRLKENKFLLRKDIRFSNAGNYTFFMEQAMRVRDLEGIADVGIRIDKQN